MDFKGPVEEVNSMSSKRFLSVISPSAFRALAQTSSVASRVIPIDCTWYMPNVPQDGFQEFQKKRIPGSVFFDLDKAVGESAYPHMLPTIETFNKEISRLGINHNDKLVFYDKIGNFSSPRAAWTFSLFNHKNVYLLNHFPLYSKSEYPIDETTVESHTFLEPSPFESVNFAQDEVVSYEELHELVDSGRIAEFQLFDARSTARFTGEAPEPRAGLSSGHVPTAQSLPFDQVLNVDKTFQDKDQLVRKFSELGVVPDKTIIVMCGTGVTAVILKIAFNIAGFDKVRVYDGSWTEWAQRAPEKYIVKS